MKRPLAITIIGWLFIIAGIIGFVYHLSELNLESPFANDAIWILLIRILAIAGGVLTLRGHNVGRWLLVTWLVYHVALSYFHSVSELAMHAIITVAIAYFLFRREARAFFKAP